MTIKMDVHSMKSVLEERFDSLERDYEELLLTRTNKYDSVMGVNKVYVDSAMYTVWVERARELIKDSYGYDSAFYSSFIKSEKGIFSSNHTVLIGLKPVFDAARRDLKYIGLDGLKSDVDEGHTLEFIIKTLERFPSFCRQLGQRHNERSTVDVNDEYDVQDLVHSILVMHFDDVRQEEGSPSHAGSSSRLDFLLKKEKIVIEVKKSRASLKAARLGEELIVDMERYSKHPDCDTLVCFVYDPDYFISNPKGVISDLERSSDKLKTRVVIAQS